MPWNLTNTLVPVPSIGRVVGTGWLPPMVDPRDVKAPAADEVKDGLASAWAAKKSSSSLLAKALAAAPPSSVDLRPWCSPIEDQMQLGSCTANAAMGIVEYSERKRFGKHLDGSRLFVYKTTRNLLGVTGDTGAWLRNTMAALVLCGVPNERYWPYTDSTPEFDLEPPAFVYAVADNYESLRYFAHDPIGAGVAPNDVVASVKSYLVARIPSMFGFWGYGSFDNGDGPGHIPLPTVPEQQGDPAWGHAIVAVGYDDTKTITNTVSGDQTEGALLIRNSWGVGWGEAGYGWMPYDYVINGLAMDFWSLLKMEWVDSDRFFT